MMQEAPHRLALVDTARGIAVVAMIVYHGSWDLTFFGLTDWPVATHWAWVAFRTLIAGSFLGSGGHQRRLGHAS